MVASFQQNTQSEVEITFSPAASTDIYVRIDPDKINASSRPPKPLTINEAIQSVLKTMGQDYLLSSRQPSVKQVSMAIQRLLSQIRIFINKIRDQAGENPLVIENSLIQGQARKIDQLKVGDVAIKRNMSGETTFAGIVAKNTATDQWQIVSLNKKADQQTVTISVSPISDEYRYITPY